jgi:hypothetical protein
MKPLTHKETNALSLLAECKRFLNDPKKRKFVKERLLDRLEGRALAIGRAIIGDDTKPTSKIKDAAGDFISWAKSLRGNRD